MKIHKFHLHKFKRFFLSGVKDFVYVPNNNLTIISWANGMGKSSFLSQLNPLPADIKKDYYEDGFKYISFSYKNDEYILSSGYVSPGKHSFIKNQEELNPGGTANVQRQLVQEHLILTPQINQVLLGNECFTNMSPATRKYWFTQLSPIDYTYPVTVFQNIKSRLRDLIGNVKITQDEIIKRNKVIVDKEKQAKYVDEINEIEKIINKISLGYNNVFKPEYKDDIENVLKTFERCKDSDLSFEKYFDLTEDDLVYRKGTLVQNIKNLKDKLDNLDKLRNVLKKTEDENIYKELKAKLETLNKDLEDKVDESIDYKNLDTTVNDVTNIVNKIRSIVDAVSDSEYISLTVVDENNKKIESFLEQFKEEFNKLKIKFQVNEENIKHLEKMKLKDDIKCPKCSHTWKQGFDNELYNKSLELRAKLYKDIEINEKRIKTSSEICQRLNIKRTAIDNIKTILQNSSISKWSKDTLAKLLIDTGDIRYVVNDCNKILQNLNYHTKIRDNLVIRDEISDKIKNIELARKAKEELNIDSLDKIEKDIETIIKTIEDFNKEIVEIENCLLNRKKIEELKIKMNDYVRYRKQDFRYLVTEKRNEMITEVIGRLKNYLVDLTKLVNENESNKKVIESLQNLITSNNKDISVLQALVKILSPESGLIAKSMNSFLNVFIDDMNSLINQVWSYPIEILPCEIEDSSDLNYKFKVKVNHDEITEDVSKLSSSQKEIVDLSFKVMFMKYMGLENYPLFLDEFGKTMDPEHRIAAFDVIDKVLTNNFELTLLVCHFESMYTRFVNAQFLELKEFK